ncbi:hypothetical protein MGYG_01081 [Nannizzia gypsea CBS 118893]|uniref:Mid2 domain-containing protein n=1 Tax=Arthroderma gypseum (strain ATCC MYA-4604 / CBS 118893) TaxID=535722 RepID=E5QYG7_ARTGP|nr:hypothetical protein MGYG_01081 [Nannizzia gypsea CBS 118893]EFQ98043.1 hypothetical protein MGYG_01081 [Nannizzia gypsea CBS 118893]
MGILPHILFLLSHSIIFSLALDCQPIRISGLSGGQPSHYHYKEEFRIRFGQWSDNEIKTCIGKANSFDMWLISEHSDCPYAWPVFENIVNLTAEYDVNVKLPISKEDLKWSPFHLDLRATADAWYEDVKLFARSNTFLVGGDEDTTSHTTITSTSTSSYTTFTTVISTSTSESSLPPTATVVVTRTLEPTATGPIPIAHGKAGLSTGAKAGIGTGVAFGSIAIAAAVYIIILLRRRQADKVIPMLSGEESNKYSPPGPPEMHDEVPGSLPVVTETNDPQKRPASEMLGSIPVGKPSGRVGEESVHYELP